MVTDLWIKQIDQQIYGKKKWQIFLNLTITTDKERYVKITQKKKKLK